MRVIRTAVFYLAGCFILRAIPNTNLGTGSFEQNGIKVIYVTVAEPGLKPSDSQAFSGGFRFEGALLHRWMGDKTNRSYFGYDLTVEAVSGTAQCRVSILPLSMSAVEIVKQGHSDVEPSWRPLNLPGYPAPQIVEPGDTVALDLLVSSDGKQKIVDYFRTFCGKEDPHTDDREPARDFTLQEVKLDISNGSLYQDSQPVSGTPMAFDASAPIVWFYFPGKGRFLVSISPHDGYDFQKLGTIRKNHITFEAGGTRYEVRASHPIAGNGGVWNAYVMLDRDYPVRGPNAAVGGADNVEKVLERK